MLRDNRNAVQRYLSAKLASSRRNAESISFDVEAISDTRESSFCDKISSTAQRGNPDPAESESAQ
jgi:hypothetical protein